MRPKREVCSAGEEEKLGASRQTRSRLNYRNNLDGKKSEAADQNFEKDSEL